MQNNRGNLIFLYFVIIIGFLSLFLVWGMPVIHLEGKLTMTINVGKDYHEPGFSAYTPFKNLTKKVKIDSNVDTKKVGTYEVRYSLNYKIYHLNKTRVVKVVDKKKPEIILTGDKNVLVCPSKTYVEEGYQARDNYDKDITSKVKITTEKDKITYSVTDNSKNKTSVTRKIVYKDETSPEIKLSGESTMDIYVGSSFDEPGYMAYDNCEGDITSKVTVSGSVDSSMVGTYSITYHVVDASGNETTAIRTVNVIKKDSPIINGTGKVIYLTFDDGPSRTITPQLLQILREENVKATFFVTNHDDSLNYLIKQASDDGHTIALHSYTHNYSYIYSSTSNYFQDLTSIENKVEAITGKKIKVIRFPGGSSNTVSRKYQPGIMTQLSRLVLDKGYVYFDWNVDSEDAGRARTKEDVYYNVTSNLIYKNNVILMHDFENNYKTLNAIRDIIQYGKQNGYTFKAISKDTYPVKHGINN